MKRILASIVLTSLVVVPAFAQIPEVLPSSAPSAISYQAPDVTLLPTHPLYKLQLIWNRLSILTTSNPSAKAMKYITLADKDLIAADKIMGGENDALALHTAFRGEHYMTLLVNTMKNAAYNFGSLDMSVTKRAHEAFPYHQQLIQSMISKASGDTERNLRNILEFSQRNEQQITLLEQEYSLDENE